MYRHHAPLIGAAMREDPEIFKRACVFVILSIRTGINRLESQMDEVDEQRASAPCLFGWKRKAYQHIQLHGRRLHAHLSAQALAVTIGNLSDLEASREAIRTLLEVPGLGIVKAAFVAQLFGFDVACIDSRNAEREGRKREGFKMDKGKTSPARLDKLLALYLSVTHGRAEEYWDAWCNYVALDYKLSGEEISAMHLVIVPDNYIPF